MRKDTFLENCVRRSPRPWTSTPIIPGVFRTKMSSASSLGSHEGPSSSTFLPGGALNQIRILPRALIVIQLSPAQKKSGARKWDCRRCCSERRKKVGNKKDSVSPYFTAPLFWCRSFFHLISGLFHLVPHVRCWGQFFIRSVWTTPSARLDFFRMGAQQCSIKEKKRTASFLYA
jgi:hypothetical protein